VGNKAKESHSDLIGILLGNVMVFGRHAAPALSHISSQRPPMERTRAAFCSKVSAHTRGVSSCLKEDIPKLVHGYHSQNHCRLNAAPRT
jgi:hypothetical protein